MRPEPARVLVLTLALEQVLSAEDWSAGAALLQARASAIDGLGRILPLSEAEAATLEEAESRVFEKLHALRGEVLSRLRVAERARRAQSAYHPRAA